MANRLTQNATLHDKDIQAASSRLDTGNYDIYTNSAKAELNGVGNN